jgi:glucose uptake protein GlcU
MNHLTADKLPVVKAILSFAVTAVCCAVLMSVIAPGVRTLHWFQFSEGLMYSMSSRFVMTAAHLKRCGQVQGSMGCLLYSMREYS